MLLNALMYQQESRIGRDIMPLRKQRGSFLLLQPVISYAHSYSQNAQFTQTVSDSPQTKQEARPASFQRGYSWKKGYTHVTSEQVHPQSILTAPSSVSDECTCLPMLSILLLG